MLSFLKHKVVGDIGKNSKLKTQESDEAIDIVFNQEAEDLRGNIYDCIRTIRDPEKPNNLEELEVVVEDLVRVVPFGDRDDKFVASIEFVPTIPHCNLATLIGLCIRTKLERLLPPGSVKLDISIKEGSHNTEGDINKQINDKERVAAALENPNLLETVEQCILEEN